MSKKIQHLYEFDEYLLNVGEKNLWRGGELVQMPPKVFETLCLLIEKRGKIVTKDEMLEVVWTDSFVEESNISQNIYTLRQMFGKHKNFIKTVPKKGYLFTAPVKFSAIENVKTSEASTNGNLIVATQTKTHIIEETTFEEENENEVLPKATLKNSFGWKTRFIIALGTIFAFIVGIFSYHFYQSHQPESSRNILADIEFKSLTDTGDAFSPTISPGGKFIAYLKRGEGGQQLHLQDVESGNDVGLKIESSAKPGFLQFSPDGKRIFFRTDGVPQSPQKIYEISYFGGQAKLVAEDVWGYFSFSPDGGKIAFCRREPAENRQFLLIKNLETGEENAIIERSFPQRIFLHIYPAWSPDGKKIAFVPLENNPNRSDLSIIDVETKREELLKSNLAKIEQIAWLPNSKNLVALAKEADKGQQIWQIEYPGGLTRRITNDLHSYRGLSATADGKRIVTQKRRLTSNIRLVPEADLNRAKSLTTGDYGHHGLFDLRWTADGKIIYDGRGAINRDLWITDSAGANQTRLTENNGSHNRHTAISNDGRVIFFVSDRNQSKNIWRMNADGTNPIQITFGENEDTTFPALSPDEKWLYFISQSQNSNSIWRKSLIDAKMQKILESKEFSAENFLAVSPDNKYLAFYYFQRKNVEENLQEDGIDKAKISFLNLSGNEEIKTVEINSSVRSIQWTNGGNTFDYVNNTSFGGQIWRQSFTNENAPPELVFQLPKENIFRFAWSADGKDLAIAQGTSQSDVVILEIGE